MHKVSRRQLLQAMGNWFDQQSDADRLPSVWWADGLPQRMAEAAEAVFDAAVEASHPAEVGDRE